MIIFATLSNPKVSCYASRIILNIYLDASYSLKYKPKSGVAGASFLGNKPENEESILLNENIFVVPSILKFVVSSVAEAELGVIFIHEKTFA